MPGCAGRFWSIRLTVCELPKTWQTDGTAHLYCHPTPPKRQNPSERPVRQRCKGKWQPLSLSEAGTVNCLLEVEFLGLQTRFNIVTSCPKFQLFNSLAATVLKILNPKSYKDHLVCNFKFARIPSHYDLIYLEVLKSIMANISDFNLINLIPPWDFQTSGSLENKTSFALCSKSPIYSSDVSAVVVQTIFEVLLIYKLDHYLQCI